MTKTLKMPVLGQSVEEVRIIQWLKKEGDPVQVGENLAEIETDKVATFFESPESGFVRQILAPADSFVAVEAPVVVISSTIDEALESSPISAPASEEGKGQAEDTTGSDALLSLNSLSSPSDTGKDTQTTIGDRGALSPRARRTATEKGVNTDELAGRGTGVHGRVQEKDVLSFLIGRDTTAAKPTEERMVKASPLARAVAEGSGVDLAAVSGTGAGGRIVADDVLSTKTVPATPNTDHPPLATNKRTVTLSGLRKRVADNIMKSVQRAPHVTLHLSADMGAAMELRKALLPPIEKKTGIRLSPTDIIIKAAAVALTEHPYMNAHIEGDTITYFDDVHIGLAVSLGEDGLIVPLIRDAHRKGLAEIAQNRDDIAKRARANTLTSADIQGGTFSVSNLGNYGIEGFNPIIAPPQVAILGVGGIADAVVARGGAPMVRPLMTLSLSFDHRATDGAPAAAFLARLKEILETPALLLL
ncbi:MAG: 2-oxo acid dehydrogenase subunit E2 [Akkermansiaceae bacterium]|nr:2-oxo acid dehydrogenase subunit E2 [Armatimonadota bacterium]